MTKEILNKETYERTRQAFSSVLKGLPLKKYPSWSGWIIPSFMHPSCTALLFESGTEYWLIEATTEEAKGIVDKLKYMSPEDVFKDIPLKVSP